MSTAHSRNRLKTDEQQGHNKSAYCPLALGSRRFDTTGKISFYSLATSLSLNKRLIQYRPAIPTSV